MSSQNQSPDYEMSDRGESFFDEFEDQQNLDHLNHIDYYSSPLQLQQEIETQQNQEMQQSPDSINNMKSDESLKHNILPEKKKKSKLSVFEDLKDSLVVAQGVVNSVLKKTDQMIYTRYIDSIIDTYSVGKILLMSNTVTRQAILEPDEELDEDTLIQDREDIEPKKPVRETWIRNQAEIEVIEDLANHITEEENKVGQLDTHSPTSISSRKQSSLYGAFRHKPNKKSKIGKDISIKTCSPVNKAIPQEIDEEEEKQRFLKELDWQRKDKQEKKEKVDQQIHQKARQELKKDSKNKFTYDFNGEIVTFKAPKYDIFPKPYQPIQQRTGDPATIHMKQGFEPDSSPTPFENLRPVVIQQKNQKDGKKGQQQVQQTQQVERKSAVFQQLDNQLTKVQPNPKLPYNEFNPNNGVTLVYNQQVKEGPKLQENINTLEDLEFQMRMLQPNEPMQITRSEFCRLTQNGNLVANFKKGSKEEKLGQSTSNILKELDPHSQMHKTAFSKIHEESGFSRKSQTQTHFKREHFPSSIKVKQPSLQKQLKMKEEDERDFQDRIRIGLKSTDAQLKQQKVLQDKKKGQTPNDEFNLRLMHQPDWGKQKGGQFLPNISKSSKQNKAQLQQTLNTTYKLPRERSQGQGFLLSKALQTNSTDGFKQFRKTAMKSRSGSQDFEDVQEQYNQIRNNPYNFRGNFHTTHTQFTDTLRSNY